MSANTTTIAPAAWSKYFCNAQTSCPEEGFTCHYKKYCIPPLKEGETCLDEKDTVAPFVARVNNVYTLYCDMPQSIAPQETICPHGCEKWEDCHGNICFLKKCTQDQIDCKNGKVDSCMGVAAADIMCYQAQIHGTTSPKTATVESTGLSSAQVGGIAGGVSTAVLVLAAVGGFFLVRRRRAAKAKAQAQQSALPTYSEKNAMAQVSA
ncbi:hypothetical protein BGZ94_009403 [Podila epigama]|nr:hypothetical protein BGZ94_009403 [Podila epigama]